VKKIGLSFGDEEEVEESGQAPSQKSVKKAKTRPTTTAKSSTHDDEEEPSSSTIVKKRLKPSASVSIVAKAQTKSALAREAQLKESLRKQYLATNEAVRATDFVLPFVFFEAKDMAGGKVRLKKGDFVWLLLERARKIGIELGERGEGPMGLGGRRREWARIGVDDLMVVVGEMMVPHVSCDDWVEEDYMCVEEANGFLFTAPRLPLPNPQLLRRLQRRPLPFLL
jgi:protein FAM50